MCRRPSRCRDTGSMLTISGADLVWTGAAEIPGGIVRCAGGRVVEDDSQDDGQGEILDASGCVVTPGLVNAHHHLLQTAFRTLPGTRGVPMREWLPRMAAAYAAAGGGGGGGGGPPARGGGSPPARPAPLRPPVSPRRSCAA